MTKRVLILQRRLPRYRVSFFTRLRALLAERGIELDLVHGTPADDELSRGDDARVPWATLSRTRYVSILGSRLTFQQSPPTTRPDLVVVPHETAFLPSYRHLLGRYLGAQRVAFWGHAVEPGDHGLRASIKRCTTRLPDWWFAYTSLSVERVIAAGFPRDRITCVENAVETADTWTPGDPELERARDVFRREVGLEGGEPTAVFLGSLSHERCFELLLASSDVLRARLPAFRLIVVGDGPMMPFLQAARRTRPWIHLAGARSGRDKVALCSLGQVILNPGMVGLNIVDAFALRLPMVTTNGPAHSPEIAYLVPGENGLLTEHRPEAFAEAAERVLSDHALRSQLVAGCDRAAGRYTVENMASRFSQGVSGALSAPPRRKARTAFAHRRDDSLRVLVFHPALAPYRVDFFNALATRCTLRVVFLRDNPREQAFDQKALRASLKVDVRSLWGTLTIAGRTFPLGVMNRIRRFQPDVVVTPEFSPTTLGVAANRLLGSRSLAHVVWTDDNPLSVQRDSGPRRIARWLALQSIDGLVVVSEETRELYRSRYRAAMPTGVSPLLQDEDVFRARLRAAAPLAVERIAALGLSGRRVLLSVGRLAPEKRVDRLLYAFAESIRVVQDASLVVVGDGKERASLEQLARTLGIMQRVTFAGRHEGASLEAWYLVGSVFALASEYEPFGAVVNEALLAGLPVVCTDQAGSRSLVRGPAGVVVDASDHAALTAAVVEQLRAQPGVAPPTTGNERPSLVTIPFSRAPDAFIEILREAAASRPARRVS